MRLAQTALDGTPDDRAGEPDVERDESGLHDESTFTTSAPPAVRAVKKSDEFEFLA